MEKISLDSEPLFRLTDRIVQSVSKALEVVPRIVLQSFDHVAAAISSHSNESVFGKVP